MFDKAITIGPEWFDTVKKDYADWQFAWAREAGQNSLDAGASRIDVSLWSLPNGNTKIIWKDNGCGMDADTLETKFMAIGGSDKPNGGTGGFGVAKLILAFAQVDYRIRSRDIEAHGRGAGYSVEKGLPFFNGLKLTVTTNGDIHQHEARIIRWVRFTTTKCEIFLNGKKLPTLRMHKPRMETPWCKIYTHTQIENRHPPRIRVRMNRQYMFNIYSSVPAHICVDLVGKDSKEYLTSNRDGLNWSWRHKLQKLVEEIYEDPNKIKETSEHTVLYRGTKGRINLDTDDSRLSKLKLNRKSAGTKCLNWNDDVLLGDNGYAPTENQQSKVISSNTEKYTFKQIQTMIDGFDVVIVNQTSKEIPDKWIPGKMNNTTYRLLNRWIRLAQTIGEILGRSEEVSIGFVFSHSARAMYKYHDEHGHMLLVNPVNVLETRFVNYWRNDNSSFYEMVAAMVHEMTHIDNGNHNEGFAKDITYSMAKVMGRNAILDKIRKETI